MRLGTAAAQEVDTPTGAGEAGHGRGRGGRRRDPPSGEGGVRLGCRGPFGIAPPAPEREGGDAGALGRKLQPPRGDERQTRHLTHDPGEPAMPERLLHGGQDLPILPGLDIDDPVGMEPDGGEGGREEVASAQAPENAAFEPGEAPADEEGRGRDMLGFEPAFGEFMQGAERQPPPGKVAVDGLDLESKRGPPRPGRTVEGDDPAAQIGQSGIVPGMLHALLEGVSRWCCS